MMRTIALVITTFIALTVASNVAASCCCKNPRPPDQRWNPPRADVTPELMRFYELGGEMGAAYGGANPADAASIAKQFLEAAKIFSCNWNYGNAIHDANSVLGLLALRTGNKNEAISYLKAAGASPGSPTLDTFGPSLLLANELVTLGEYDAVIDYLRSVKGFWKMDRGQIDTWISELSEKKKPDFRKHLSPF